jgi:HlyD family secretion protein
VVLKRFETGPGHLSAGTRLLELGRLADLEALAEVLTQDVLNLRTGMPVTMQAQDGGQDFGGTIKSLEPAGFTKPSSLGVEQQRVDVLIGLASPPPGLGVGYRVQATFVTETRRNALLIPRSAVMQAPNGDWYVFVCEAEVLRQRPVRPGLMGDRQIEILEGVRDGDSLVAIPDSTFHDGGKVKPVQPRP